MATETKLKLAKRREVERVRGEAVAVLYRADLIESTFQAIAPGNGNGVVERAILAPGYEVNMTRITEVHFSRLRLSWPDQQVR